jgi:hypothetical protein
METPIVDWDKKLVNYFHVRSGFWTPHQGVSGPVWTRKTTPLS